LAPSPPNAGRGFSRRRLNADQILYAQGDPFHNLYAVRSGTLKSTVALANGRMQICGFHTAGEVVALDGIASGAHSATVTALEEAQVCVVACAGLQAAIGGSPAFHERLRQLMSLEIARGQRLVMLLGVYSARERLAAFVMDMSMRFQSQGYSARDFRLRMTRTEIGSYLGMTRDTVSRTFSLFRQEGLMQVDNRRVRIQDPERLKRDCERPAAAMQA
jgi:CRP/FNR family transcriptional regulator